MKWGTAPLTGKSLRNLHGCGEVAEGGEVEAGAQQCAPTLGLVEDGIVRWEGRELDREVQGGGLMMMAGN